MPQAIKELRNEREGISVFDSLFVESTIIDAEPESTTVGLLDEEDGAPYGDDEGRMNPFSRLDSI